MKIAETSAHFIGVGGVGMSALAQLFHQMGAKVSGSDVKEGGLTKQLAQAGIQIHIGHDASNISESLDVVVYSSAINEKNPEIKKARELGIPIIPRAEALAEIMRFKRGIAVGGTHGKTTTTSMISSIFMHSNMDPTIAVGGRLKLIQSTARLGQGPWMVAEADESDGSFSRYSPEICIITNIDSDHLDHFGNFENLQKAFLQFALNIPFYGAAVVWGDDPKIRFLFKDFAKKILFYGIQEQNDFILKPSDRGYELFDKNEKLGAFKLQVPGVHNALNAVAAAVATHLAGVPWGLCFKGLNEYSGVDRRFQKIGEHAGIQVFDDYAHHPTEIAATVAAARELIGSGRLFLVYQPHRYSRTRDCWQDYRGCFQGVDQLFLTDIYPAGELPIEGVHSRELAKEIQPEPLYFSEQGSLIEALVRKVKPGDIVLTMGAGDIWAAAPRILEKLSR